MKTLKKFLTDNEILLHIVFSENYNCKYAAEPQSVHFGASRDSVTLHTNIAYFIKSKMSFCTISKSLRHDSAAIIVHLIPILQKVLDENPKITHLHFLSDSPATQYRNKTISALLTCYLVS